MSQFEDKSLREFLKANQPIAPEPRPGEFASLVQRLNLPAPETSGLGPLRKSFARSSVWLGMGSALAAGLMGLWMFASQPTHLKADSPTTLDSELAVFDDLSDEEELPTVDVGEEFLGLMASRGE